MTNSDSKVPELTDHRKDQLLAFFQYTMPMEQRRRLMAEMPQAYNALVGKEIVQVVHTDDGSPVGTDRVAILQIGG